MGTTVLPCLTPPPAPRGRPTWPTTTLARAPGERALPDRRGPLHHPPPAMTPPATGTTSCEVPVRPVPQPPGRRHRQGPQHRHRHRHRLRHRLRHRRDHRRTCPRPALRRSSPAAGPRGRRLAPPHPPHPPRLPQHHAAPPPARRGGSPVGHPVPATDRPPPGNPATGNPATGNPATAPERAGLSTAPQHRAPDVHSAGSANACDRRSGGDG